MLITATMVFNARIDVGWMVYSRGEIGAILSTHGIIVLLIIKVSVINPLLEARIC